MRKIMRHRLLVGLLATTSLLVAACGDDSTATTAEPSPTTETTATTTTTSAAKTTTAPVSTAEMGVGTTAAPAVASTTTIAVTSSSPTAATDTPQAIISLSPTATEMLYAIGAGEQILAVDDFSNYPAAALEKQVGLSGYEPNVEAVAELEPDLVVTDGTAPQFLEQLDSLGIPHFEGPAATNFADVYTQIEQLGARTGNIAGAAEVVANMQRDLQAAQANLPELDESLSYYHELDPTYFTVTSGTFIGAVYGELGLENIADNAQGGVAALYPQLNAEFIIEQQPDLIFNACSVYCETTAESIAARPGWDTIPAVANGAIIDLNDDIASRWGPRIVELVAQVSTAIADVEPAAASS